MKNRMYDRLRDQRGATLVLVALGMVVFLGMVALAVDLGMLLGARTESQRVADAAALAGAASFLTDPTNVDRPREWAIEYAGLNTVHGQTAVLQDQDVDVLLDEQKVRVRVYNVASRSTAIATIFGRVLGWESRDVSTVAAAEASPANKTKSCPIPVAIPDRWLDGNDDDLFTGTGNSDPDLYVPFDPVEYEEFGTTQIVAWGEAGDFTGYYDYNLGDVIEIKTASGEGGNPDALASPCLAFASWRCFFQPLATNGAEPTEGGVEALRPWIWGCPDGETAPIGVGDWVYASSASGEKSTIIHEDFQGVMNLEPDLYWNGSCVVSDSDTADPPTCIESGYRVRTAPVVDPTTEEDTGANLRAQVIALTCLFLEQVGPWYVEGSKEVRPVKSHTGNMNLYIRLIPCGAMDAGDGKGTVAKALRLVRY